MRTPKLLVPGIVAAVLVACVSSASPTPSTSIPHLTPEASPPAGSSFPTTSAGSADPSASAPDEVGSLADLSGSELFLASGIHTAIRRSCARAPELPEGAFAGLQCHPEGMAAIGFYLFPDRDTMRDWYFARLAEFGVEPQSGEVCRDGQPGEGADNPGEDGYENRIGCYVDASGAANVRMAFPAVAGDLSVYVGAAGETDSISELLSTLFEDLPPGATGCNFCIGRLWFAARAD